MKNEKSHNNTHRSNKEEEKDETVLKLKQQMPSMFGYKLLD